MYKKINKIECKINFPHEYQQENIGMILLRLIESINIYTKLFINQNIIV